MNMKDLLSRYTAEIMDYNLGSAAQPECTPCSLTGQEASRHAHRIARLLEESGRENIVLFGVGCAELAKSSDCLIEHRRCCSSAISPIPRG